MTPEGPRPPLQENTQDVSAQQMDAACDRFENAWRGGRRPRIEDFVNDRGGLEQTVLLRELIALEVDLRRESGEQPRSDEYLQRFPQQGFLVQAAFADTALRPRHDEHRTRAAHDDTSRNLLFGLLALRDNFIDRDALVEAFKSWASDRARTLGHVLVEAGRLSPGRHMLLEALVDEHIRLHGDDTDSSLASLSWLRDDLAMIADVDFQATITHVAGLSGENDRVSVNAACPGPVEWKFTANRFRILRPHAKGGHGEVVVALDMELNREVALKRIQTQFADDPHFRSRFLFEAEVTGNLEHPGIVPVYGLGRTGDGRPYYAMRLIKGTLDASSLKDAIRRFQDAEKLPGRDPGTSSLELRELLGRFIDACDAIAYAHSRGVIHRDLKPANIMLGKHGETLVVDWGLAKSLRQSEPAGRTERPEAPLKPAASSELEATVAGEPVGTPSYMSPEQAEGRVSDLGVWTDVYGLGATLYHILTGHAPCEAENVRDVYQKVLAAQVPRPRMLNPRIAQALEAICMKALALRAADRYQSADALKADLEHWLADEPVTAWREPLSIRARRWGRRHRTFVTTTATALTLGLVGLAGFGTVITG
jgi:serine/threonine-protein kinase